MMPRYTYATSDDTVRLAPHLAAVIHWHGPCPRCGAEKACYAGNHPFDPTTRTAAPRLCGSGSAVCRPPAKEDR